MSFKKSLGKSIVLLLIILILIIGGLLWFDYLGVIQAKSFFAPVYKLFGLVPQTSVSITNNDPVLMSNLEDQFEISYEDVGEESVNIFGLEVDYTNYGEVFVNDIIKDKLLDILGQLENQLDDYAMDVAKDYIEDSGGLGGVIEKILPFKE